MTARNEYMRNLMRERRAQNPTSRKGRMEKALGAILVKLDGRTTPIANELRAIAEEGLK